jgi:hypothetical protein
MLVLRARGNPLQLGHMTGEHRARGRMTIEYLLKTFGFELTYTFHLMILNILHLYIPYYLEGNAVIWNDPVLTQLNLPVYHR